MLWATRRLARRVSLPLVGSGANRVILGTPSRCHTTVASQPAEQNLLYNRQPFWHGIERWRGVSEEDFLSFRWQRHNTIRMKSKLLSFLQENVSIEIPPPVSQALAKGPITKSDFLTDVEAGMTAAPMSVSLTPYILSLIDWTDPINDPLRRQFVPLKSLMVKDHHLAQLDSLHETDDSPVKGIVHRYPDRVLFLATGVCPVYCRFCTRSYAVGADTEVVTKDSIRSGKKQLELMFEYIETHPQVQDVVVSGGDAYSLHPHLLTELGERLLSIPNVKRIRIASKGLAVCPTRILDESEGWVEALIGITKFGRALGKSVALHTHFNHANEITWITELAARKLFSEAVTVRNQAVLLRGVNDTVSEMSALIRRLADINIQPYYIYQQDMVAGVEDLRTPLSTIIGLEKEIRGSIAGFMMPSFVVDLPGGGGKRPVTSYESYDEITGVSKWKAPAIAGDRVFEYHDPKP